VEGLSSAIIIIIIITIIIIPYNLQKRPSRSFERRLIGYQIWLVRIVEK